MHVYMDGKTPHFALIQTNSGNTVYCSYRKYRVSIKSFHDYKHLLQENYVEYKHIFFTTTQVSFQNFMSRVYFEKIYIFVFHVQ